MTFLYGSDTIFGNACVMMHAMWEQEYEGELSNNLFFSWPPKRPLIS